MKKKLIKKIKILNKKLYSHENHEDQFDINFYISLKITF